MINYLTEKYIVLYGSSLNQKFDKCEFTTIQKALDFADKKIYEGYDVNIKQVNIIMGWEEYLHMNTKLSDDDIDTLG